MLKTLWNRILQRLMFSEPNETTSTDATDDKLSSTLNAIPDLMFELDSEGRHWDFRALRPELLVAPPEQLLGKTVSDVMPAEAAEAVMLALKETIVNGYSNGAQILLPTPVGERWFEVSMARKERINGEKPRFIALSRDITDRKEQQFKIEKLAYTDILTSLPNRLLFQERLHLALQSCEKTGLYAAVLFMDLDNFKQLNDTRGHNVGDVLLKQFANRLRSCVRSQDLVARWGGDEFTVMIEALGHDYSNAEEQANLICNQIIEKLNRPYDLNGYQHDSHVSIGVRVFNRNSEDLDAIIKDADTAMYDAKKKDRSQYAFYRPSR